MPDPVRLSSLLRADVERFLMLSKTPRRVSAAALIVAYCHPRFMPVFNHRFAHWLWNSRLRVLAKLFSGLNFLVFGIEIAPRCKIGGGLCLPHTMGTVIGANSIGENATIFQGVTLGARELDMSYDEATRPTIGNDVVLGAGAKVLGGIHVGDGVVVGANAVVVEDVQSGLVVAGVPAVVVKRQAGRTSGGTHATP